MKYFYQILAVAFIILAPPRIAWCLRDDFEHPDRWGDLNHNPYVTLVLLGVCLVILVGAVIYIGTKELRLRRQREEKA